jgi:hypothetical protein
MDAKISEFAVASTLSAAALIPIVDAGTNKVITSGVFATNLPNIGNKGITKNVVLQVSTQTIPLLNTVCYLSGAGTPYILPNGVDGQEIKIISGTSNSILPTAALNIASISMNVGSSITLIFVGSITKWVPLSVYNCTLA